MAHVCERRVGLFVDNCSLVFPTVIPNVTPCLFSYRSGANLAVNDNNGSFISTLSMHLYNVGAQKGPSQGPTTHHFPKCLTQIPSFRLGT